MGQATPSLLPTTTATPLRDNNLLKSLGEGDVSDLVCPTRQHRGGIVGVEGQEGLGHDGTVDGRVCFVSSR
jgi:hypothetical protein